MTYRLAHLSDLHAGYASGRATNANDVNLREMDGYQTFKRIARDVIDSEVDGIVICGDVFHSHLPPIRAVIFVQNVLRKFWEAGIPVYMLAGNHDTNDVRADIAASRILHDPWRKIYSHAEPYVKHEIADGIFLHIVSHHMYSEQAETMKQIMAVPDAVNIFATHGSCIDPLLNEKLKAESSPREIVIPDFLLKDADWSYALLGHIHERGWVGSEDGLTDTFNSKIYYNGSAIRRGFSDKATPLGRGWTLWTIDDEGEFSAEPRTVPQRPQYDFDLLDCSDLTAADITSRIVERLRATQGDEGAVFNAAHAPLLRQRVTNLTASKKAGLDLKSITAESQHGFSWRIHPVGVKAEERKESSPEDDEFEGLDILSTYDKWADSSESLSETDEEIRANVRRQARDFIEIGLEKTFEDE